MAALKYAGLLMALAFGSPGNAGTSATDFTTPVFSYDIAAPWTALPAAPVVATELGVSDEPSTRPKRHNDAADTEQPG